MSELEAYRGLFIAESRENHETLVKNLLVLEKTGADFEAIGDIFRAVHTLKGSSASMGFSCLERLCHAMEDIFQLIRNENRGISAGLGDLLLSCSDMIEQMLDDIEGGGDTSSLDPLTQVAELQKYLDEQGGTGTTAKPSGTEMLPVRYPMDPGASDPGVGNDLLQQYDVTITISPECAMKDVRAELALTNAAMIGSIRSQDPAKEALDDGIFDGTLRFRIATSSSLDCVRSAVSGSEIASVDIMPVTLENTAGAAPAVPMEDIPPAEGRTRPASVQDRTREIKNLRVDITQLDRIMNLVEELVIDRGRLKQIGKKLKNKELDETIGMIGRTVSDLQGMIMTIRMIPLNHIFNRLPRVVRDVAQYDGKEVEFIMEGGETELDRSVMDGLNDPLLHLIRNAVNHGIELPEERQKAGKPRTGTVRLSARQDRANVVIEMTDDGSGIALEKVKAKAVEKGLISREAADNLSAEDAIDLLFQPGFSTADKISDISGRGVGLDVVKRSIESLKGTIRVETLPGKGSRFELRLPPTMAIVDVMLVRVNDRRVAIPLSSILEVAQVAENSLHQVGGKEMIVHRDEVLPFYPLDTMFGRPKMGGILIIMQYQKHKCGIPFDSVEGQQEVVVKPMSVSIGSLPGINGITILGDGDVVPVFDVTTVSWDNEAESIQNPGTPCTGL